MSIIRSLVFLTVVACCMPLSSQEQSAPPQRDPMLLDVLARALNAAGGAQALASVHDLTESGEITFHWGKGVKGAVKIQTLGGNHLRMEADLPEGKRVWVVKDGTGSRREADHKAVELPYANAVNLGNLTFPIELVAAALGDPATDITLVGIEEREGRSTYRLRLKGRLGLVERGTPAGPVVKDALVDALTFAILTVEDHPYSRKPMGNRSPSPKSNREAPDTAPREIAYGDFRVVNGVRVPFSIDTKLEGQQIFSIRLDEAAFNTNLNADNFAN
jgi:hypothetical protein